MPDVWVYRGCSGRDEWRDTGGKGCGERTRRRVVAELDGWCMLMAEEVKIIDRTFG
jgi:hypothetical protein